ncbi:hypothetical protein BD311DRAFT_151219 [Dichomitus squalens]|uniref:Uncharacterized protein n=1 Tax=Dichomitus squalens TaxID=114155 RepID=A0A4Q9MU25_9APHY|nr:hypothetical protein BD311DRAFT_151219 [Dichomitus squalens]
MSDDVRGDTERIGPVQSPHRQLKRARAEMAAPQTKVSTSNAAPAPKGTEGISRSAKMVGWSEPVVVGERQGEPAYKKPRRSTRIPESRGQRDSLRPGVRYDSRGKPVPSQSHVQAQHDQPGAAPKALDPPVAQPEAIYRPPIGRLQESILALDEICRQDARVRAKVADIQRLLDVIQQKESDVCRKIKHVQKTRLAVEALYVANVKAHLSLVGEGTDERTGTQGGSRDPNDGTEERANSNSPPRQRPKRLSRQVQQQG